MSLDFWLEAEAVWKEAQIFVRENGSTTTMSWEEYSSKFPGREPFVTGGEVSNEVFSSNITHNLIRMADEAGIYECLWRPNENGYEIANQIILQLENGLRVLKSEPERFRPLSAKNGWDGTEGADPGVPIIWGTYDQFVLFVEEIIAACKANPNSKIRVSR